MNVGLVDHPPLFCLMCDFDVFINTQPRGGVLKIPIFSPEILDKERIPTGSHEENNALVHILPVFISLAPACFHNSSLASLVPEKCVLKECWLKTQDFA